MNTDFTPGVDPEEVKIKIPVKLKTNSYYQIKDFLHGLGLIPLDEYYGKEIFFSWELFLCYEFLEMSLAQVRQMLKRQRQSSKLTNEQIQRKLTENGFFKDDLSKNIPVNILISIDFQ